VKLLVTCNWNPQYLAQVQSAFPQVEFVRALSPAEQLAAIEDAEVVFGHLARAAFLKARRLRWVQCHSAGVEWLAHVPELVESDVVVTNTRGAHAGTIAEHTFGMLIFLARGFRSLVKAQEQRVWLSQPVPAPIGLAGLTLGVVGHGNIGQAIARLGRAFGMRVLAVDARESARTDGLDGFWLLDGLPELLRQADVVAVAAPYTPETRGMLGAAQLALLKPTAFLLVVSRGGIVDEPALVAALKEGRLAGAGLDVTAVEPLPADSPLWDAPNLFLTPHCSGRSERTTAGATAIFRDNLARYLAGRPLTNVVDKRLGY
jgi:phosphoglycerate dehydrogenase-like enzyme